MVFVFAAYPVALFFLFLRIRLDKAEFHKKTAFLLFTLGLTCFSFFHLSGINRSFARAELLLMAGVGFFGEGFLLFPPKRRKKEMQAGIEKSPQKRRVKPKLTSGGFYPRGATELLTELSGKPLSESDKESVDEAKRILKNVKSAEKTSVSEAVETLLKIAARYSA